MPDVIRIGTVTEMLLIRQEVVELRKAATSLAKVGLAEIALTLELQADELAYSTWQFPRTCRNCGHITYISVKVESDQLPAEPGEYVCCREPRWKTRYKVWGGT